MRVAGGDQEGLTKAQCKCFLLLDQFSHHHHLKYMPLAHKSLVLAMNKMLMILPNYSAAKKIDMHVKA